MTFLSDAACVVHNPGGCHAAPDYLGPLYAKVIEYHFFRDKTARLRCARPKDLSIVTWNSLPGTMLLEKSLRHLGIDGLVVLGRGVQRWHHRVKITLLLEYLKERCATEYVLCLDARDVLVVDDPRRILNRFQQQYQCDVLFGASISSWPFTAAPVRSLRHISPVLSAKQRAALLALEEFERKAVAEAFCHLNSGCLIGKKDALIRYYGQAAELADKGGVEGERFDDQWYLRMIYKSNYPHIQVDSRRVIFQNLGPVKRSDIRCAYLKGGPMSTLVFLSAWTEKIIVKALRQFIGRCVAKVKTLAATTPIPDSVRKPPKVHS